jgi:hypothetical protein
MAPGFLFADDIKSGRLIPILTEFSSTEHAINVIYPHRRHLSAKVRSFIDLVTRRYHEDPSWADPCKACSAKSGTGGLVFEAAQMRAEGVAA